MTYDLLADIGTLIFVLGMILWMISQQLVIRYTQNNLKSLCKYLYGNESYYKGKLNMYEMLFMTFIATPIFIQYHFIYKRKGYFPMFKNGASTMHNSLDQKNTLLLIKDHYQWLVLNVISLGLALFWFFGSMLFMFLAKRADTGS